MREEKRWLRHENGLSHFSLLAAKLLRAQGQRLSKTPISPPKMPSNSPENIRESNLNITALFGEINPDMPYLCGGSLSGPQRAVFAFFPSVRRETMRKSLNRRF